MKKLGKNMNSTKETLEAFGGIAVCACGCSCSCSGMSGTYANYYTFNYWKSLVGRR